MAAATGRLRWIMLALLAVAVPGHAEASCESAAKVVSIEGRVEIQREDDHAWRQARLEDELCIGDRIQVGQRSRAAVGIVDTGVLRIDAGTTMRFVQVEPERSLLDLIRGAVQFFSREPATLRVHTPYVNAGVEGTEFFVSVASEETRIIVYEGTVVASNAAGEIRLNSGESAVARAGGPPAGVIVVQPREAVQWSLYYPPILAGLADRSGRSGPDLPEGLAQAARLGALGDTTAAFDALAAVSEEGRGADFYLYRAALLLSVGRVEEARRDIETSLRHDPSAALAFALRAVIAVAQNDQEQALADGRQAETLGPALAASRIANSYALQANGKLEAARDTLLSAVANDPVDSLAWARLSEVWLALGYADRAVDAAERAVRASPNVARAQAVLGFANLAKFQIDDARASFARAIELDPASPLPRLGMGLADIRKSDLHGGRRQIEIAVSLDTGSAILRSYLGRAYFEEKRDELASEQFTIAKDLDPRDPTAYFYDAILEQTGNRPVEALGDARAALTLNDNRFVYRGEALLNEDVAARGAALARIYQDLGFEELGVLQASQALAADPGSAAAHRFLSDIYRDLPRREISRVSELLQAQLLQDGNIDPVQPRFAETNLNIITQTGPVTAGFNEFTPLFRRNEAKVGVTGAAGNYDTYAGEAVASLVHDRLSVSAGHFHYQTEGFRDNFDANEDVTNVFAQIDITDNLSLQAEYFRRDANYGDLTLNFDPEDFSSSFDNEIKRDTARLGGRYDISPKSKVLFSVIYSDIKQDSDSPADEPLIIPEIRTVIPGFPPFVPPRVVVTPAQVRFEDVFTQVRQGGVQGEAQHIYQSDLLSMVSGFGVTRAHSDFALRRTTTQNGQVIRRSRSEQNLDIDQENFYTYFNINYFESVKFTVGMGLTRYEDDAVKQNMVNPKLGIQWMPRKDIRFRAAVTRTVTPPVVGNRTIEPTQVAGFSQFFDDPFATKSLLYGIGVDFGLLDSLSAGLEATWRDFEIPIRGAEPQFDKQNEQQVSGFVYWAPHEQLAFSLAAKYDEFESETELLPRPKNVTTVTVPLSASFFHPSGFFAELGFSFVHQDVDRKGDGTAPEGTSEFVVVDVGVGYRLPGRLGMVSLVVNNIFDRDFDYLDESYREFSDEPSVSRFIPARTVMGRATIEF